MAINKNALIRYKILDRCFRNTGRRYDINDLIEECSKALLERDPGSGGISRRTVYDDIAFMESSDGWEIELIRTIDKKKVYFRYKDPEFSINNMPLNEAEISQLKSAIDTLAHFKGMPQFDWMNELIPKLQQGVSTEDSEQDLIQFDSNQYLKGIEHLGPIYNAISQKRVIVVKYQPYGAATPYDVVFHPYCLKQYNNRWFAFGLDEKNKRPNVNLALDRILTIEEVNKRYKKSEIDWSEYFEDIVGVSKPENEAPENVILHFVPTTGKYVESKPIHGSQKSKWLLDGKLEVRLNVVFNYELEQLLLGFCENVEVIKPSSLRKKIQSRLGAAKEIYYNK